MVPWLLHWSLPWGTVPKLYPSSLTPNQDLLLEIGPFVGLKLEFSIREDVLEPGLGTQGLGPFHLVTLRAPRRPNLDKVLGLSECP